MTRQVSHLEDLSKPHLKKDAMGRRRGCGTIVLHRQPMERPMKRNDLSQSLVAFDQASRIVSVVEFGLRTWLVAGLAPGLTRLPLKKLGADAQALLTLLRRWQGEATKAGSTINRICRRIRGGPRRLLALRVGCRRGIEAYVIHPTSPGVARTSASKDGPTGCRIADASASRLAAWRAEAL